MEFGLFFLMQRDEAWTEPDVYDSGLEQMLAAEALGYSSVWIAEHHFNDYGLCPSPPVLAAFVAARTTTLRLGMGVSLLPLHHPVDLAEQLAVLDVVSGGRLDVGIGRGGTLQDYQTFQSDRGDSRARVEEGIELIRRSWGGAPFDFQGRFHSAERLHVRPRPAQRPHPPLFIGAGCRDEEVAEVVVLQESGQCSIELGRASIELGGDGRNVGRFIHIDRVVPILQGAVVGEHRGEKRRLIHCRRDRRHAVVPLGHVRTHDDAQPWKQPIREHFVGKVHESDDAQLLDADGLDGLVGNFGIGRVLDRY